VNDTIGWLPETPTHKPLVAGSTPAAATNEQESSPARRHQEFSPLDNLQDET